MLTLGMAIAAFLSPQDPDLREQVRRLTELVEKQNQRIEDLEKRVGTAEPVPAVRIPAPAEPAAPAPQAEAPSGASPYSQALRHRFGTEAGIGGYMDLEFRDTAADGDVSTFRPHRLVPLIHAELAGRVNFYSEIEIEDGHEVEVEFAHGDLLVVPEFNVRAGIILDPVGRYNLEHDSPLNDLTDRPLVDQFVIPTTLREPGLGFFGVFDLDPSEIRYELYVGNGFKGLESNGTAHINTTDGLRGARPHEVAPAFRDFNNNKSVFGRLQFSPVLGFDLGLSGHVGTYDQASDDTLAIYAADLKLQGGALANAFGAEDELSEFLFAQELKFEAARADLELDVLGRAAGIPGDLSGFYGEWNYHFMPDAFRECLGDWAGDETTFTFTTRFDDVDTGAGARRRLTLGLNFRPVERTVFKLDWLLDMGGDDDGLMASFATYF